MSKPCEHDGMPCTRCGLGKEIQFVPERWVLGFRGLAKWQQVVVGVPIIVGCVWWSLYEALRHRGPSEPRQAFWFELIYLVVAVVLSEVLRPKPHFEDTRPLGLGDFQFPTATEGRPVPRIWGKVLLKAPNVVWYGDLQQEAIVEKVKTGMFSSTRYIKGFRYSIGVQMAFCRGPGVVLKQVFIGDDQVLAGTINGGDRFDINEPALFGGEDYGQGGMLATVDFYSGETTQAVNAYLNTPERQQITTAATPTAPAYNRTCYMAVREMTSAAPAAGDQGAYFGNSTSIKPWSIVAERYPGIFPGQTAGQHKIGDFDCNPINVIYELLQDSEEGFSATVAEIDVGAGSSFLKASDTLIAEGNGFSMALDRSIKAKELLREIARQIDGVVFPHPRTGKWTISLAREPGHLHFGYDIDLVPQFTDSNVKSVKNFVQGDWADTSNQIQVKFDKREDNYKESYALAQDMANAIILGGGSVFTPVATTAIVKFPGVKDSATASRIAWRELRGHAYPLARAEFTVNRESWDLLIGGVFAWTNARLGFVKLPMRVSRINYGTLDSNEMVVTAVQDVFSFALPSGGTPPATGWVPPEVSLVAYPADEQMAFEAPRAVVVRDPEFGGDATVAKIFAAARRQGYEVAFDIMQRNAAGAPSGTFALAGTVVSFLRIGKLNADLAVGSAYPLTTLTIEPGPDTQNRLESIFNDDASIANLGTDLTQLILVGTEFMLVRSAAVTGPNVNLQNVYRGALDSPQQAHLADDPVYLIFFGGGLSDASLPNTNNVDVQLRMRSSSEIYAGSPTTIALTMAKRALRPYPPAALFYNSGAIWNAPALEGDGAGLNGVGFDVEWRRRRYDTTDEVAELLADQAVDGSTEYRIRVFVDPNGANVLAYDSGFVTGAGPVTPTQVAIVNEAAAGTLLRVNVQTRHDVGTETNLESRYELDHKITPTSARSSQFYLGGDKAANVATAVYTAVASGTFTVNIGGANATGAVQYRINGGAWTSVIAATLTTGTIPGVVATDTIELRHTVNETPARNFVELVNPSAVAVAYGVFTDGT